MKKKFPEGFPKISLQTVFRIPYISSKSHEKYCCPFFSSWFQVTVERDLSIRKAFDNTPLLWTLLKFVAIHRPALCTCSVLLRAITASLIAQWSSASQGRLPKQNSQLVDITVLLLEIMSLGQLLPPPLSGIRDIVPHLLPQHVSTNHFFKINLYEIRVVFTSRQE